MIAVCTKFWFCLHPCKPFLFFACMYLLSQFFVPCRHIACDCSLLPYIVHAKLFQQFMRVFAPFAALACFLAFAIDQTTRRHTRHYLPPKLQPQQVSTCFERPALPLLSSHLTSPQMTAPYSSTGRTSAFQTVQQALGGNSPPLIPIAHTVV